MEAKSPNNDSVSIPIVVPSTGQTEDPSEEQATITTRHFRKQAPREKNRALSQISPRIWVTWCNVYYKIPLEPRTFRERLGIRKKGVPPEWKEILFGLSGDVKPGEIIGMLGSSGAGKTTLLNVLAGRLQAGQVQGDIRVNGAKRGRNWKRIAA